MYIHIIYTQVLYIHVSRIDSLRGSMTPSFGLTPYSYVHTSTNNIFVNLTNHDTGTSR